MAAPIDEDDGMPVGSGVATSLDPGTPVARGAARGEHPPTRRPRRPGVREAAAVLLVAAIPTAVFFLVSLRHMTYAWDDFVQFGVTLRFGVGRELLTYDLFEHFGPLNRLAHGLLVTFGGLDTRWALALALPLFFAYCAALTDLARLLGASWGRVALGLAVATVTPATVSLSAVFDQFFHVMVPVAATAAATAAYVRWVRTRRFVHVLVGAVAVALACAVQERGVFILLFLALARVLVIDGGVRPGLLMGGWLRVWLRDLPFLALPLAAAVATTTVVALGYVADAPRGGLLETAALVGRTWAERLVPMVTGAWDASGGSQALSWTITAAVLVLLAWSVRRNPWNVRPWLLALAWSGFLTVFLGLGRLGLVTVESALADPHNLTYSLPAVMVLISCLDLRRDTAVQPTRRTARRVGLAQLAAALVLAGLVVLSSLPASGRAGQFAPTYLRASVADVLEANESGPAIVAPTRVPDGLVPAGFAPYNSGELYLREIDPHTVVDLDPVAPRFLDATGRLTAGTAALLARVEPGAPGSGATGARASTSVADGDFCVTADGDGRVSFPLPSPVDLPGGAAWLRVVAAGAGTEGTAAAGGGAGWSIGAPAPLTTAHGSVTFMVPAPDVSQVDLLDVRAPRLCIEAVEVWVLSAVGPGGCGWVGPGGEIVPAAGTGAGPRCTGPTRGPA